MPMQHGLVSPADPIHMTRRQSLRLPLAACLTSLPLTSLIAPSRSRAASLADSSVPPPFPDRPLVIVAGADDGPLSPYARAIADGLDQRLPATQAVRIRPSGGADGVTAANQFEASELPDGHATLMVSGAAAMAWLRGDPRAQYDIGHWLPVLTSLVSGVVLAGPPSHLRNDTLLAFEGDAGMVLPAVLGLDLIGVPRIRVVQVDDAAAALQRQEVDVAFLRGERTADRMEQATAAGGVPLFSLGDLDSANQLQRDPFLPHVPILPELLASRADRHIPSALLTAWNASAAAARLEMALLLPWLTPAGTVSWWRGACGDIALPSPLNAAEPEHAATANRVLRTDPTANFGIAALAIDSATSLALHRWMIDQPA
jgi:hypothetical protein